jgi:type I restriction-modification system DNA methylase subunit
MFQNSVVNKYLISQDKKVVFSKWNLFKKHFHSAIVQQNIRKSKEEQYQGEFLIDLFVNVLGYTKNPTADFNLTTEYKNVKDSKKADGAIIISEKVRAVIELKGSNTTDLGKVEVQAFGYKNNQSECTYVITSNFEKLRFYIDNATEYLEFNLFRLTETEFELLYLCLAYENVRNDIPKKIKDDSVSQETLITKRLYKDYSLFKNDLYQNLVRLNPQYEPLELFKKSQKLLDRFLFIFFAEDRNLLPTNLIFRINKEWQQLREMRIEVSLYDRYKIYFKDLNTGAKVSLPAFSQTASNQKEEHQIYAYNGGLFKTDEILEHIDIDDELLFLYTEKLSHYDFQSEVDVNILGHIFENSLNDIEEIKAILHGNIVDITSRRKKDGVFYTPKHITKYIVDSTIGRLCELKKIEFEINDDFYQPAKQRSRKRLDNLQKYRHWLLNLKICDPACGSGAFLNQALEFLIKEHCYIDELSAKYNKDTFVLFDVENSILENNLFGVDINHESVEIARLSLWLRTAQTNRKLNDLSGNIKQGNSLISDVGVAGKNAFNWGAEFSKVFENGGFDVVIGNPPYVFGGNAGISETEKKFFKETYITGKGKVNLFTLFIEKSYHILKEGGEFSFIIPNTFLRVTSYQDSREFFINNFQFRELVDLGNNIFDGAVTSAIILIASKQRPSFSQNLKIINDFSGGHTLQPLRQILKNNYVISSTLEKGAQSILNKLHHNSVLLGTECEEMIFGVVITGNQKELIFDSNIGDLKPFLEGKDISPYLIRNTSKFLKYKTELIHRARSPKIFEVEEKLLVQRITGGKKPIKAAYDNQKHYNKESINNIILKKNSQYNIKFILALLNSNLINWFYTKSFTNDSTLTVNISKEYLSKIPIKKTTNLKQLEIAEKVNLLLTSNNELLEISLKFQRLVQRKFILDELSKKIQEWYLLTYKEFVIELGKKGVRLSLKEESEWEDYFKEELSKALQMKHIIDVTNKIINQMIYELYELNEAEITIVENK